MNYSILFNTTKVQITFSFAVEIAGKKKLEILWQHFTVTVFLHLFLKVYYIFNSDYSDYRTFLPHQLNISTSSILLADAQTILN